jgi:hypothetical protein
VLIKFDNVQLNFGEANSYRVEIYYSKDHEVDANRIREQLKSAGFKGEVILAEKIPEFWDYYGWGRGNEIRFDSKSEELAINYLYRFIEAKNPSLKIQENPVEDSSRPNSVAIHLPPKSRADP